MYNHEPTGYECPFCLYAKGGESEYVNRADIVYENARLLAFVSSKWWPNNPGNVIVIPKTHAENVYDIQDELLAEMTLIGKKVAIAMKKHYGCEGTSFRQHNEPAGDQEVWHYHLHVLPRWEKDGLYINHKKASFVPAEKRKTYADKLRGKIA